MDKKYIIHIEVRLAEYSSVCVRIFSYMTLGKEFFQNL